jgi:D-amino-acid dehydrogenase
MKVIVVGSGLIGVSTAWFLRRRGHDVTVLERAAGPGLETSFANGGMLTPGMSQPWNAPGSWRMLLRSLGRSDSALQLRFKMLPRLVHWGSLFLRNSTCAAFERNRRANLEFARYSIATLANLRQETHVEYGRAARGSLGIFRHRAAWDRAWREAEEQAADGLVARRLTIPELVHVEPALAPIAHHLQGAILYETDEVGDAYRYCHALASLAAEQGVQFRFDTEAQSLQMRGGRVAAVRTADAEHVADAYVIAAGSYSPLLLRSAGVRLPVQPAKGYSVTFADANARVGLRRPIIDHHLHAVIVPFEDGSLRAAGTAEFAGYDRTLNAARLRNLLMLMHEILPGVQWDAVGSTPWCGLRSSSPDGLAIIGSTAVANLWVNSGQGHLGWTFAAGSARLLSDLLSGDSPRIDPNPYALARFARAA